MKIPRSEPIEKILAVFFDKRILNNIQNRQTSDLHLATGAIMKVQIGCIRFDWRTKMSCTGALQLSRQCACPLSLEI